MTVTARGGIQPWPSLSPSPAFRGRGRGPRSGRVRVCTPDSARPSPPKPSAWAPPLPRRGEVGLSLGFIQARQALRLVLRSQRADQLVQLAFQYLRKPVQSEVD